MDSFRPSWHVFFSKLISDLVKSWEPLPFALKNNFIARVVALSYIPGRPLSTAYKIPFDLKWDSKTMVTVQY